MEDLIIVSIIFLILGISIGYIYKSKKNGNKCIGCPNGNTCNGSCNIKK